MIYYTSDTHFGHENIIRFCNRPYKSVTEMDTDLIHQWNQVVKPDDSIYHLGDFAFRSNFHRYLSLLNGRKHLIWGNHDNNQTKKSPLWASSQPYLEVKDEDRLVILFHYPMKTWNKSFYGSYHLFGHVHGTLQGDGKSKDAGVDCWGYKPKTLTEIFSDQHY